MEYCFLKGLLVFLLIEHCTSEGPPVSIQSSTVALEDAQALPEDSPLPPAEVVPVVAPPSLREVQQAVQEASEQVEGRGAEEVLKGLLERVVEAALGQVEGGDEGTQDEAAVMDRAEEEEEEAKGEDAPAAETGEAGTLVEVLQQGAEEEVAVGMDITEKEGVAVVEEEQEAADRGGEAAQEGDGVEGEAAGGSLEENTTGVETGGGEAAEAAVEVTDESPDAQVSQEVVEEDALEEAGDALAVEDAEVEDNSERVVLSEGEGTAETETQEADETPAVLEEAVGGEPEQETAVDSDPSPGVADVEQVEDVLAVGEAPEEEIQVYEMEGEAVMPPSDNYEIEAEQTAVEEPAEEAEAHTATEPEGKVDDEQGPLTTEGGTAEEVGEADTGAVEEEGGEGDGDSEAKKESEPSVIEGGEQQAEEEEMTPETTQGSEKEDHEAPAVSTPEPGDSAEAPVEQNRPAETSEWAAGGEKSDRGNEIITPTDDLLLHESVAAQPTLDNSVKDVLAVPPEAEGEEPGEANELVEDTAAGTEISELGLEAWKIGAISAATFLVLETAIIIIYILKCRNKNSTLAQQRSCEEGCVEPEAATGGDCSDDTLPAGNGDTQQIALLDPSDVTSTPAQDKEQHQEEQAISMSNVAPSSAEESASTGPGPDPSPELRTSML